MKKGRERTWSAKGELKAEAKDDAIRGHLLQLPGGINVEK